MRNLTRSLVVAACLSLGLATTGCGPKATTATIPGALNNADAQIYQNMHTAQAAIEQAKADIAKFPQAKDTLNKVIASYNVVESAYQTYHATAAKGGSVDWTMLQSQVSVLLADIGKLQVAMGVKK